MPLSGLTTLGESTVPSERHCVPSLGHLLASQPLPDKDPYRLHHCHVTFPGIVAALTWPASLLSVASVIDNPWGVCLHRSAEVGKHLAHILLSRQQVPGNGFGWGPTGDVRGLTRLWTSALKTSVWRWPTGFGEQVVFTAPPIQVMEVFWDRPVRATDCIPGR